ncbi:MAG: hypothetical protein BWX80_04099 [Candidatus Hydrogenedentes bacterium ADurb.Bin101]|nr:MAG: hypothetical protein BWX80_04099 [Candidatus Hydrogenedentes bacterium ADurb.Bin101]
MPQSLHRLPKFKGCQFKNSKTVTCENCITAGTASGKAEVQKPLFKNNLLWIQPPLPCLHRAKRLHRALKDARTVHFKNSPPPDVDFQGTCSQLYFTVRAGSRLNEKTHCQKRKEKTRNTVHSCIAPRFWYQFEKG